jgi:hypothetical protein
MKIKVLLLSVVVAFGCLRSPAPASARPASGKFMGQVSRQREVKVYFYHEPGEYIDLSPVKRKVNASSPARAAIAALLAGPTRKEKRLGYDSLASANEFRIGSLTIVGGVARVNFVARRSWLGWPGDTAPVRFRTAVELTLKQFPNVRQAIVSLNGDPKFADEQ